jgi:hypothetical protein
MKTHLNDVTDLDPDRGLFLRLVMVCLFFLGAAVTVDAQQTTGVPGSPSATTTIDGKYLPNPPSKFGGVINLQASDSKPYWPPQVVPPKGAPNILLIMTDDQGYGICSTFGGVIPTAALDRVAKMGLRYTQFHSTALCSPTRAALITGRNHHSVGFGIISEQSTGYPGYNSIIGADNATIGNILKQNGYATAWFGKNHNTPSYQYSAAGRTTTSRPIWPTKPSHTCNALTQQPQINRSSFIMFPAAPIRLTSRRRSGSRRSATCICLTRAGTICASRFSPTSSGSA